MKDKKLKKSPKSVIQIRVDPEIKEHLNLVLKSKGMSISEAIRLYLWQIITQGGLPFKGFVSNKLPVKPEQNSEIDTALAKLNAHLQLKLFQQELEKLRIESEEEIDQLSQEEQDIIQRFIERKTSIAITDKTQVVF